MNDDRAAAMNRHPAGKARHMLTPPSAPHPSSIIDELADLIFDATVPRPYSIADVPMYRTVDLDTRKAAQLVDYVRELQHKNANLGSLYANESNALARIRTLAYAAINRDIAGDGATVAAIDVLDAVTVNPIETPK